MPFSKQVSISCLVLILEAYVVLMTVEHLIQHQPETFTLCFRDKSGDIHPVSDIETKENALYLANTINKLGFVIKLKELSQKREISVYKKSQFKQQLIETFESLKDALAFLNINVDFEVEPPEI